MVGLILILTIFSTNEPIGRVTELWGEVFCLHEGTKEHCEKGQDIFDGDAIETERSAFAFLVMADGSEIEVQELSRMTLTKELLMKDTAIEKVLYSLKLFSGKLITKIAKNKERWVNVGTPTSIIGVRGTEFYSGVAPDGSTILEVTEGEVEVLDEDTIKVKQGERAEFDTEEGLKIEPITKEIDWDEWFKMRRERFVKRRKEIEEILNRRLKRRMEKLESIIKRIEQVAEEGKSERMKEEVANLYSFKDNLETGVEFMRIKGLRAKIEKRFKEVASRWEERRKMIAERFEKRRRELEERFERRHREMEERFEKRKREMEKIKPE